MAVLLDISGATSQTNGGQWSGQSFIATDNWLVDTVDLDGVATFGGTTVYCHFWPDDGGSPSKPAGSDLSSSLGKSGGEASGTFPIPGSIPTTFTFASPVQLLNGVKYWVLVDSTEGGGGGCQLDINIGGGLYGSGNGAWGGDFSGPYVGWSDQSTVDVLLTINGTVGLLSTGKRRGWTTLIGRRRRR